MTADRPPELRGTGANQTIDQTKMFGDAVRWWAEVHSDTYPSAGRHWRSVASHAWQRARGRPRGPVHLNVSLRDPLVGDDEHVPADTSGRPNARPWQTLTDEPVAASDETVERLAARISATERGLIVAGDADIDPDPITSLARTVGWPVLAEPVSGLRSSEMAVSTYDALLRASPWAERHRPDLVIRVGNIGTSKSLLECLQNGVDQILIDADAEWLDATRAVGEIIRCDPSILAAQLLKAVVRREDSRWATSWAAAEVRARHVIDVILDDENRPTEPRIARDLADLMPPGSTLVVASSMPVRELDSFMRARPGVRIIGNRGASGIDGFVSTAIGVSLASSGPVTALAGDLSILHDAGGLATLGGPTPRLTFVVVNNDGGGIFSFLPQSKRHRSFETLFGTPHGIDFGRLAELYGCDYSLLNTAGDLASIIVERHKGMRIIEARTNRVENVELHRRIWAAVGNEIGTT